MFRPRRWRVQLLAGALMLAAGAALGAGLRQTPSEAGVETAPPGDIEAFLSGTFTNDRCITATEADQAVRGELLRLGYQSWTVTWRPGVTADGCVGYDFLVNDDVALLPALSPVVRAALETFREETFSECFSEAGAITQLDKILTGLEETGFEILPGGPAAAPLDRIDEIREHIDAGCVTYSGTGVSAAGTRIYYVTGPH